MPVPYTFGNATTSIPLSQLDTNFATAITIGNTAVQLGNTITTMNNLTLANVTISSGNATVTTLTAPTHNSASSLTFQTNGTTTAMTIDTSQNVGIGTTSPQTRLHAFSSATTTTVSIQGSLSAGANTPTLDFTGNNGAYSYGARIQAIRDTVSGGYALAFGTTANNAAESSAPSERMRIDSSGNVGIGTSSPGANSLTLASKVIYMSSGYGICWDSTATQIAGYNTNILQFITSSSERMRIDSSGNLLVGTTTAQATVTVYHAGNQKSADFYAVGNASGTPVMSLRKGVNDATTTNVYVQFLYNNGSTGAGQINGNGGSQAAFGSYSDARLKENIQSLSDQLEKVCSLRPVEFDYKDGNGHQIGFIAQEIQTIYPDVVSVGENEMLTVTGWNKTEARLVQAIKELAAKVEAQATEIAALKAKVGV